MAKSLPIDVVIPASSGIADAAQVIRDIGEAAGEAAKHSAALNESAVRLSDVMGPVEEEAQVEEEKTHKIETAAHEGAQKAGELHDKLGALKAMLISIGLFIGIEQWVQLTDTYSRMTDQLDRVSSGTDSLISNQQMLFDVAQAAHAPLAEVSRIFVRLDLRLSGLGFSAKDVGTIVQEIAEDASIEGGSFDDAAAALEGLIRALNTGKVSTQLFRAFASRLPELGHAIAHDMGFVGASAIRQMQDAMTNKTASPQLVTRFLHALESEAGNVNAKFKTMSTTVSDAMVNLSNAMLKYVGEMDRGHGLSKMFSDAIEGVAHNFKPFGDSITVLTFAIGGYTIGMGAAYVLTGRLWALLAASPFGFFVAVLGSLLTYWAQTDTGWAFLKTLWTELKSIFDLGVAAFRAFLTAAGQLRAAIDAQLAPVLQKVFAWIVYLIDFTDLKADFEVYGTKFAAIGLYWLLMQAVNAVRAFFDVTAWIKTWTEILRGLEKAQWALALESLVGLVEALALLVEGLVVMTLTAEALMIAWDLVHFRPWDTTLLKAKKAISDGVAFVGSAYASLDFTKGLLDATAEAEKVTAAAQKLPENFVHTEPLDGPPATAAAAPTINNAFATMSAAALQMEASIKAAAAAAAKKMADRAAAATAASSGGDFKGILGVDAATLIQIGISSFFWREAASIGETMAFVLRDEGGWAAMQMMRGGKTALETLKATVSQENLDFYFYMHSFGVQQRYNNGLNITEVGRGVYNASSPEEGKAFEDLIAVTTDSFGKPMSIADYFAMSADMANKRAIFLAIQASDRAKQGLDKNGYPIIDYNNLPYLPTYTPGFAQGGAFHVGGSPPTRPSGASTRTSQADKMPKPKPPLVIKIAVDASDVAEFHTVLPQIVAKISAARDGVRRGAPGGS